MSDGQPYRIPAIDAFKRETFVEVSKSDDGSQVVVRVVGESARLTPKNSGKLREAIRQTTEDILGAGRSE